MRRLVTDVQVQPNTPMTCGPQHKALEILLSSSGLLDYDLMVDSASKRPHSAKFRKRKLAQ